MMKSLVVVLQQVEVESYYSILIMCSPLALLCLIAGLKAYHNFKQVASYKTAGREAMKMLDLNSAQLQLQFSLLLAVGLIISHWL